MAKSRVSTHRHLPVHVPQRRGLLDRGVPPQQDSRHQMGPACSSTQCWTCHAQSGHAAQCHARPAQHATQHYATRTLGAHDLMEASNKRAGESRHRWVHDVDAQWTPRTGVVQMEPRSRCSEPLVRTYTHWAHQPSEHVPRSIPPSVPKYASLAPSLRPPMIASAFHSRAGRSSWSRWT